MDKTRSKRPLEEDVEVPMNIDSDESDVEDDEWSSILHHSKEDYDLLQQKKGVETSNDVSEKSQPTTVSGARILSIPRIVRLSRPPR